jgi:protein SCO1/2
VIPRRAPLLAFAAAARLAPSVGGCGGGAKQSSAPAASRGTPHYAGAVASPPQPAADFTLRDDAGRAVRFGSYAGKVRLVTFIYAHCPDICPLIVGNLRVVQAKLGPAARKLKIIAVSADPRGDTPSAVRAFLRARDMTGRMDYLLGNRPQLEAVWKRWFVTARADKRNPDAVEHSAQVYGVSASGKLTTLYPANFKPEQIVHDVPLLASR